jgi:hypothetical protein
MLRVIGEKRLNSFDLCIIRKKNSHVTSLSWTLSKADIQDHDRIVQLQITFDRSSHLFRVIGIRKGGAEDVHRRMQPPVNIPNESVTSEPEFHFSRNTIGMFVD